MKNIYVKIILPFLTILIGCSSQKFFDVSVMSDKVEYYQGREMVSQVTGSAKSILNFERQDGDCFSFYLEVENISNEKYDIHPEQIFMKIDAEDNSAEDMKSVSYHYVLDPEREVDNLEEAINKRDSDHNAATATNCLFGLFSVVHDVSNDDDDEDVHYDWIGNMIDENNDYENDKAALNADKEFWQNEVLRITTLYQNERIGGLIYIPVCPTARRFSIIIPIDGNEQIFKFIQREK